jgi:hypothetical protein
MGYSDTPEAVKNILFNLIASVLFAGFVALITLLFQLGQPVVLLFVPAGVLGGIFLGERLHYLRTKKISFVRIGGYDADLTFVAKSTSIDMIAITFAGFFDFREAVESAVIQRGAKVRVLLLDPHCESFRLYVNKDLERTTEALEQESADALKRLKSIGDRLQHENDLRLGTGKPKIQGSIDYLLFDSFPYGGCILTDTIVRYWPYLYYEHPSRTPNYQMARSGIIGDSLAKEFEAIWRTAYPPN